MLATYAPPVFGAEKHATPFTLSTLLPIRARSLDGNLEYFFSVDPMTGLVTYPSSTPLAYQTACLVYPNVSTTLPGSTPSLSESGDEVRDGNTRLAWNFGDWEDGFAFSWSQALDHCNRLGNSCGRWRLPSYKELATLACFDQESSGTWADELSGSFWTSTRSPSSSGEAYVWHLDATQDFPTSSLDGTATAHAVLCVRDL